MPIEIKAPDGSIARFPDGTDDATITAVMRKEYGGPEPTAPAPAKGRNSESLGFIKEGLAPFQRLSTGVEGGLERLGYPAGKIKNAMGLPSERQASDAINRYVAGREARGEVPGKVGGVLGVTAATVPIMAITRNPLVGGALSGAFTSEAKDLKGTALDAGLGAVAGKVGDKVVRTVGAAVAPRVAPAVKKLLDAGIGLTPGQIKGGAAMAIEDKLMSVPLAGDAIRAARIKANEQFNRAAVNEVLKPLGQSLPKGVETGADAVAFAQDAVSGAYNSLIPSLKVAADPKLTTGFASTLASAKSKLTPDAYGQVDRLLKREILPRLRTAPTGETYQAAHAELRRLATNMSSSSVASEREIGQVYKALASEMSAMLARQNPQAAAKLASIDKAYATLKRVNSAAAMGRDQTFSPAQLRTASRVQDRSAGKRVSARGEGILQGLADAGQTVMSSIIPDSGTAARLAAMAGGAGLLGGDALDGKVSPQTMATVGLLGLLAAPYSQPGRKAMQGLLTVRPAGAPALRQVIEKAGVPAGLLAGTVPAKARPKEAKAGDKR